MKKRLTKMLSIAIALALIVGFVPFAAPAAKATGNDLPAEFAAGTVVWDMESTPDALKDWSSDKFADWGTVAVPDGWEPTTVAGKGVNDSKALRWHVKKEMWGCTSYLQFSNDSTAVTDWTGATELMFYVDSSEVVTGDGGGTWGLDIGLNQSSLDKNVCVADAPWYIYENGTWTEKKINTWGHMLIPVGYVGYVRLPISSILEAPEDLSSITKILFYTGIEKDPGKSIYFDQFTINVAPSTSDDSGDKDPVKPGDPIKDYDGTVVWDVDDTPGDVMTWVEEVWGDGYGAIAGCWTPSVANKGVDGSAALGWTVNDPNKDAWARKTYINFSGDANAVTDWTGATEVMFYIDASEVVGNVDSSGNPLDFFTLHLYLNHDTNKDKNMKPGQSYYLLVDGEWVENKVSDWGHMFIPAGYTGYVRVPFAAMESQVDLANVEKICFYIEHLVDDAGVYFDNFTINVHDESPDTGDTVSGVVFGFMGMSAISLAVLVIDKKKFI